MRPRVASRLPPLLPTQRAFSSCHAFKAPLALAFQLHQPPKTAKPITEDPIVIMHGLFGSKQNNRSISKVLARDLNRPVYAIDLRNHGDSPHDSRHDYVSMAEDVEQFIVEHSLGKAALIGHSMGAKAAMVVALRSPQLVSALIPVDNAPIDAALKSDFGSYVRGMREIEDAKLTKQSEADAIMQKYEDALPIRQFLLTNLIRQKENNVLKFRVPVKTLTASLNNMADFPFTNPDEKRYEGPTLFVRGTKSHYTPDDALPITGRFFPRFRLEDVEAGHWVISENPEAFRRAVVNFLEPQ